MNERTDRGRDPLTGQRQASGTELESGVNVATEEASPPVVKELSRFIDYTVVDQDRKRVGTVDSIWADHTGQPAYLAVRTGWLGFGKLHVVPAQAADVSEANKRIRLPYTEEQIKHAPAFDHQANLDENAEMQISRFYEPLGFKSYSRQPQVQAEMPASEAASVREEELAEKKPLGTTEGETTIQLKEEELRIGKRQVEYGGVRLRRVVRTETVSQPVDLLREEIVIERVPAKGEQSTANVAFEESEKDIYIPLRREEAVIAKEAHVREEVRVGKRSEVQHENVTETIRKEDIEIEQEGSETEPSRMGTGRRPITTRYEPKERGKQ